MTTTSLPKEDRQELRKLLRLLDLFRDLDNDIPIQMVATYLIVSLQEGMSVKDVCDRLGMATSTASRNIAALSKVHRLGRPGFDLVVNVENPMNRREKLISLTQKGKGFRKRILELMKEET